MGGPETYKVLGEAEERNLLLFALSCEPEEECGKLKRG